MISIPKLMVLTLLLSSLPPITTHAQTEQTNSEPPAGQTNLNAATLPATAPERQAPQPVILSLNAAISMAVHRNIDLRIESQNSKMAEVDAIKSRGIYNPVLNVSGSGGITAVPGEAFFSTKTMTTSIGLTQNLPTGGNISAMTQSGFFRFEPNTTPSKEWQSTAGITLSQPLLRNAGKETFELNITLAATTLQDSVERFRAATSDTVSNVVTAYNRLYVLRQVQQTREAALLSAQTLLNEIRKKEPGAALALEIANAEFAIAQRRKDFVEASRNVTDQETNLRYQIGLETPQRIVPSDPPSRNEPPETDEQAIKLALEFRSDLKQLKTSLHATQLQERVARHQTLPELSVNASGGLSGTGYNFSESYQQISSNPGTYWTAGLLFSVPLGNTSARNEFIRSKIRTEQVQDQIKALAWRIRNEVETDMRALISARLQMQLAEKSSQFAEQRLAEYRKNNMINLATIQDVLNAENDLNVARNTQLESVETFSNAVIKLWKDTGLLLDRHGIHIDKSQPGSIADSREQASDFKSPLAEDPSASGKTAEPEQTAINPLASNISAPRAIPSEAGQPLTSSRATTQVLTTVTSTAATSKTYTLALGEYPSEQMMADTIAKIKSVGLTPQVEQGPQKTEQIVRLHLGNFPNQQQAQKAFKKLQLHTANGFMQLNDKNQHAVYAGTFLDQNSARNEQTRLARHSIKVRLEKTSATVPTFLLSTGNFTGQEAAQKYAGKLEQLGLKPVIVEKH